MSKLEDTAREKEREARRAYREYYTKYMSDIPVAEIQAAHDRWREAERIAEEANRISQPRRA